LPDEERKQPQKFAVAACLADCPFILTALIETCCVDVNSVYDGDKLAETLLLVAAHSGAAKCVAVLLSHGADVNTTGETEGKLWSPLFIAAQEGHVAVCRQLIDAGAALDFRDEHQRTPLHAAAVNGHVGVVASLIQRGADTCATDSKLQTSTSVACLQLVLGSAPDWYYSPQQLNEFNANGANSLHMAVTVGSLEMCKMLIAAGADPHFRAEWGWTCSDIARHHWPYRLELAALFDEDESREPFKLCCAACSKTDCRLYACSKCHAVRYCSTACQRAHWRAHKVSCISPEDARVAVAAKYSG